MIFFIAGTLQKNMFSVIPIPFWTYTKHFRRFLTSFWSSAEQRWFRENQRWTALKQCWSALVFLTHFETALISAEIYEISETALFSADLLWDFNPGSSYVERTFVIHCIQFNINGFVVLLTLQKTQASHFVLKKNCNQKFSISIKRGQTLLSFKIDFGFL